MWEYLVKENIPKIKENVGKGYKLKDPLTFY